MKTKLFFAVLILAFFASCSPKQELTQQEKDQIKKEVSAVMADIMTRDEQLNVEAMLKFYWDSENLLIVNPDGTTTDPKNYKKIFEEQFKAFKSLKLNTVREEYRIQRKDLVLYFWTGKTEITMNDGSQLVFNPDAVTFLFQKINEEWKITYQGESAIPQIIQQNNAANKKD